MYDFEEKSVGRHLEDILHKLSQTSYECGLQRSEYYHVVVDKEVQQVISSIKQLFQEHAAYTFGEKYAKEKK